MLDDDCVFCKIIKGEIPSTKVYDDEAVLAFDDVNPQMPVHTLMESAEEPLREPVR